MAINPISTAITPIEFPKLGSGGAQEPNENFANKLTDALGGVEQMQKNQDSLAMKVASGELTDIHDYMIAANEAQIATQMTVAVKNKAVESFNQIMNMQV